MHERRLTIRYFVLSFAIGFLVLSVAAMLVVLFIPPKMSAGVMPAEPETTPLSGYLPAQEDAMNILVIVEPEEQDRQELFLLLRFDPQRGQVPVAALPAETLFGQGEQTVTLKSLYDYSGAGRVAGSLEKELSIQIGRYVRVNRQNVIDLVDLLGGVQFQLKETVSINESGRPTSMPAGSHQLSGSLFYELLTTNSYSGGEVGRGMSAARLLCALINQHGGALTGEEGDILFQQFVNMVQTDISAVDFQNFKPAAQFMEQLAGEPAFVVTLLGHSDNIQGTYTVADTTKQQLQEIFSPPERRTG